MIEVGEYVRTTEGNIGQIKSTEVDLVINGVGELTYRHWIEDFGGCRVIYEKIKKHSKNIIDLIEPGDLVRIFVEENVDENGTTEDTCVYEVTATQVKDFYGNKLEEIGIVGEDGTELIPFANVRGIVTREQFASMEYKVKEE